MCRGIITDPMHENTGLADTGFQDRYNPSVAGQIDSERRTTLPAYR